MTTIDGDDAMFRPIGSRRASSDIVGQIKALMRARRLRPGDQLPSERQLAQSLGVSGVAARDAPRTLEVVALVMVRVGASGGAFITESGSSHLVGA